MENRTITVKGLGRERMAPDQTVIAITLKASDKDYSTVSSLGAEQTAELKEALEGNGFEKGCLKTSSFVIDTEYENCQTEKGDWERRFKGYCCRQSLSLKFDMDNAVLNNAVKIITSCKKSAPTFNIEFTVKDREQYTDLLLQRAVKDAKHKAEVIAAAAGVKLGALLDISYNPEGVTVFASNTLVYCDKYRGASEAENAGIEAEAEDIESQLDIKAVWEIVGE